jgi:2-oxoglutarate ferredoxin oxidoreductase subunit delta
MTELGGAQRGAGERRGEPDPSTVLTRGTVVVDVEACKGCELCIDACPPGVLEMGELVNDRGYRYPLLRPGCTGCKACSQICPDFVFQVYKYEVPLNVPLGSPTREQRS